MVYLIGIDAGSSGCKTTVISSHGAVVASAESTYPTHHPRPGWAEQDPEEWYRAACDTVRSCICAANVPVESIEALAIDGPAHTVALLDENDAPIRTAIHWSDVRSVEQASRLEAEQGELIRRISLHRSNPSWTLAQLLWLREEEPEQFSRIRSILPVKDYVRFRMCGQQATDPYDAVGTQLYDCERRDWSNALCSMIDLDRRVLPSVVSAASYAGTVKRSAAETTGLSPYTKVIVGSGDSTVEAAANGLIRPGGLIVKLGTAGNVSTVTERPSPSDSLLTYPHVTGDAWFSIAATNSGTASLAWLRSVVADSFTELGADASGICFENLSELAGRVPPGSDGLMFFPFLNGERTPYWDPILRAQFTGLDATHRVGHLARAVMEGVAFSLKDCLLALPFEGTGVREATLIGGGARSMVWAQIVADTLDLSLRVPRVSDASIGSAILAGIATGVFSNWPEPFLAALGDERIVGPSADATALYHERFSVYQNSIPALRRASELLRSPPAESLDSNSHHSASGGNNANTTS